MKATTAYLIIQLGILYLLVFGIPASSEWLWGYAVLASLGAVFLYWPHFRYLVSAKPHWLSDENPVNAEDIKVLERALKLLEAPENWDQNDDRHCLIWEKKSLFCAIALAQKEVIGHYSHRSIPAQEVRFTIERNYPKRWDKHPIMDFNNHQATTFDEIQNVLSDTIQRLEQRLKGA
ncbi:hypothetical protein FLL45_06440 [Aliikangiella marina]|uniref:Uncharacterized protein n=1 Tax=Aliikangiella marina TaxID=1712262 RepID=A0A545TBK1_9GAMM|nr:hypothetical protein [Aliikangiella marina]TQV74598.1 hypothetical protein FLL45_06440 [Aliikangiella marina]